MEWLSSRLRRWLPELLEGLGALCLVIAAAHVATALAWLVIGVALVAKAYELEMRQR
ncbi:MAG TPA: hypothetical protein VGR26_06750 [Acidimicrobiales bacterium]|nr:hypothetical protein [Acidimicrobiales bacterium]